MRLNLIIIVSVWGIGSIAAAAELPVVKLTGDDTVIKTSCRIEIPAGAVIQDKNNDGVIQVGASDITIEFAEGSVLRGTPKDGRPDEYKGYGIRLNGHKKVTIRNARISGYWCGLWASKADGLMLEGIDASDNRRAYLKSTPAAEDGGDWLFPHNNEDYGWLKEYGSAIYIDQSDAITVRECKVWHGQNALCIDRVTNSKIYDNDFSFNSGWGIAMWRSEKNVISRNAMDFCVRGYSHGVYNRGQDSAGILMFEQNNENVIAENSATHGGDCFFGFAGREAIAEAGEHPVEWYKRRGNSDNLLIGNDLLVRAGARHRDDVFVRQPVHRQPHGRQRDLRHLGRIFLRDLHRRQHLREQRRDGVWPGARRRQHRARAGEPDHETSSSATSAACTSGAVRTRTS